MMNNEAINSGENGSGRGGLGSFSLLSVAVADARTASVPLWSSGSVCAASILVSLSVLSVRRRRRGEASQSLTAGGRNPALACLARTPWRH